MNIISRSLDSYVELAKYRIDRGIDYELFKHLQFQFIIDKAYFNVLNTLI